MTVMAELSTTKLLTGQLGKLHMVSIEAAPYYFRAHVNKVYDGDTITDVDIDLGFHMWLKATDLRLDGIDTPELHGDRHDEAVAARDHLQRMIRDADDVMVQTHKEGEGSFGRYLATIHVKHGGDWINVNRDLLDRGLAVRYEK